MDIALKQRLVGAVVIIALAVLVLPMLLGGRPESSDIDSGKIEIPPQPSELNFETRRFPLGSEARESATADSNEDSGSPASLPTPRQQELPRVEIAERPPADPGPGVAENTGGAEPEQGTSKLEATPPETPDPNAASAQASEPSWPSQADGEFIVQVASFGAAANANRMSQTLSAMGMPVVTDTVSASSGVLHRVRVGPFAGQAEADRAIAAISEQIDDVAPRVVRISPPPGAQSSAEAVQATADQESSGGADPLQRWVVQVGSFSSEANADKLVAQLRLASMSAYQEEISSAQSRIFRVRVGPFVEKQDAVAAEKNIRESLSLDGVVMSIN